MFTLFLPGLERRLPEAAGSAPALVRLLARGTTRALRASPWQYLAGLAGGDNGRWPVGPVSAAADLPAPPPACLRTEPLGADTERHGMLRLPAAGLGVTMDEAGALAAAFAREFGSDGLSLAVATPERWYLGWQEHPGVAAAEPGWRGFEGPPQDLPGDARPAPPEPGLRRLLSELEMLFHAHPVNATRRARGQPGIAGLHPWGGGRLHEPVTTAGELPVEEPYLAGLRRLGAITGRSLPGMTGRDAPAAGIAWPVTDLCRDGTALARVATEWVAPLAERLRRGELTGLRIVSETRRHEIRRLDLLKVWRRASGVLAC